MTDGLSSSDPKFNSTCGDRADEWVSKELVALRIEMIEVKESVKCLTTRKERTDHIMSSLLEVNSLLLDSIENGCTVVENLKQKFIRQKELLNRQAKLISNAFQTVKWEGNVADQEPSNSHELDSPEVMDKIQIWRQESEEEINDARKSGYYEVTGTHNVICLDISGSMGEGDTWNRAEKFYKDYLDGMTKLKENNINHENVALVTFGGEVKVQERLTKDFQKLRGMFDKLSPFGPTQMFPGLLRAEAVALTSKYTFAVADDVHVRPKIILITDGKPSGVAHSSTVEDTCDVEKIETTKNALLKEVERIRKEQVDIHCVYVGQDDQSAKDFLLSLSKANMNVGLLSSTDGKKAAYHTYSKCVNDKPKLLKSLSIESRQRRLERKDSVLDLDVEEIEEILDNDTDDFNKEIDDERYPEIGLRVRRGKNWKWDDQDSNGVGTIIGHSPDKNGSFIWVSVEWDEDGEQNTYRWANGKKSDLEIATEERVLEPGEILAVGTKVKKVVSEDLSDIKTGVVIKIFDDGDEKDKALVRWKDKSRGKYYFGKNETKIEIKPIVEREMEDPDIENTVLCEKCLLQIADGIGKDWELLATYLGIPKVKIDHSKMNNNNSCQKQIFDMLLTWQQGKGNDATFGSLIASMKKAPSTRIDWYKIEEAAKSLKGVKAENEQAVKEKT